MTSSFFHETAIVIFVLKKIIGLVCVALGLLALVTPLTPGAWLIFVGIELLGLTFLLPRRVREPWERLKTQLLERLRRWWKRQRR